MKKQSMKNPMRMKTDKSDFSCHVPPVYRLTDGMIVKAYAAWNVCSSLAWEPKYNSDSAGRRRFMWKRRITITALPAGEDINAGKAAM